MLSASQLAIWVVAAVLVIVTIAGTCFHIRFLTRLRSVFPEEWAQLGAPKLSEYEGAPSQNALFAFILFGKFYRLNDPVLKINGKALQISMFLCLACMLVLFFLLRNS